MEGFIQVVGKLDLDDHGYRAVFDLDDGTDFFHGMIRTYIPIAWIRRMRVYPTEESLAHDLGINYMRSCFWYFPHPVDDVVFCSVEAHSHSPTDNDLPDSSPENCNCAIPPSYFPLIIIEVEIETTYLVWPSKEERAKLLGPSVAARQVELLEEVLTELRYNPDAGSRVAEARERFEKTHQRK